MTDWDENEFMSQWDKKYVSTNIKIGSKPYNKEFFVAINTKLATSQPELRGFSYAIVVRPSKILHSQPPQQKQLNNLMIII